MSRFNPDFWEVTTDKQILERVPADRGLWFETEVDRARREAMREFYSEVAPDISALIDEALTPRQREVLKLYYFHGKTQEDIAVILNLTQSTVSRHLFGTARGGKKVGGALRKLRKAVESGGNKRIPQALDTLQTRLKEAV